MISEKDHIVDFGLECLPGYARFLLSHKLEDFSISLYRFSVDLNIPLLRFFEGVPEKQIVRMSMEGVVKLLTAMKSGKVKEYIEENNANWTRDQLPMISREDVIVEDISLVNYARKRAFREYLHSYTQDAQIALRIIDELDRFFMTLEAELFKTHIAIQHERIQESNNLLTKREEELLEAQALGKIGSFEWDLTGSGGSRYTPEVFKIFEFERASNLEVFLGDVHPDDRVKLRAAIEKAMSDGEYECEYRYHRANKRKILYSRGRVVFENGKPVRLVGTVADVTERAEFVRRLKESEELSKQGQALTHTGNWKWLIDQEVIEWSDEMYRIYGLERQSERITFQRFLTLIHDDDRERRVAEINEALATGKASDYVIRIRTPGGEEKVLRGKGEVIQDKLGRSIGMLGTCQDVTHEQKLSNELKLKNDELERKNRDLELFNFVASHDLQEPLRKIQIYSKRILDEGKESVPERHLKYFARICQASTRMQKMIEDFLLFYHSMNYTTYAEKVNMEDVLKEACTLLNDAIHARNAEIRVRNLCQVWGKPVHLTQLMRHLLSNALKFSKAGIPPVIEIACGEELYEGKKRFVKLSIRDNGIGFEPKYSTRIFDLFQRLHSNDDYPGTGIGLSLCKRIAEDHGGWIKATAEPGKGAEFSVYFPLQSEP